jgi:hypothetical protein
MDMKEVLIKNGYTEGKNGFWHWRGGEFGAYSAIFPSIDSAYRHYEEGERYTELEARLAKVEKELSMLRGDGK